jgi:hypothetical protein
MIVVDFQIRVEVGIGLLQLFGGCPCIEVRPEVDQAVDDDRAFVPDR